MARFENLKIPIDVQDLLDKYFTPMKEGLFEEIFRPLFDEDGNLVNTHGDYPEAMRQVADQESVPLIDLFDMSRILYEALGPENSKKLFLHFPAEELKDNTHHSTYGAYELSKCVIRGIQEVLPELASYLLDDLPEYDPASPMDFALWDLPLSPSFFLETPEEN